MAKTNAEAVFRAKAPGVMAQLISDFPITPADAAAILGNLGHECAGFTKLQEMKPTVPGSRGGYGWPQWTGPRRRAYEAYCKRTGKDPASDEANYAYLFIELKGIEGSEKAAIGKTIAAEGLDNKVVAFEQAFLRAGVKHYPERKMWAAIALDAYHKAGSPVGPYPQAEPTPTLPSKPPEPRPSAPNALSAFIIAIIVLAAAAAFFYWRF
ncbi:phage tail tip lysozyme [Devosia sediminis]|uniref:Phage tail lysozyme domain-containing protein n=1 Tax=Devosia sediminis TaxID=2798801 RepID=A0A934IVS9_9HYPH|nr:phage tail tip lysozyme [Devosia sediminis]MBJ3784016.1 hypothetical protein [Devosia sediminis]